jgi:ribosomal protein L21
MAEKNEINKFAVIRTGGKQYKVFEGEVLEVEKIDLGDGEPLSRKFCSLLKVKKLKLASLW